MTKYLIAALTILGSLAAANPAFAADQPITFERDGVHYVATVQQRGAATLISGSEVETGKRFDLRYQNGRVAGQYGAANVNTPIAPRAK